VAFPAPTLAVPRSPIVQMPNHRSLLPLLFLVPLVVVGGCNDAITQPPASVWEAEFASNEPRSPFNGQAGVASQHGATTVSIVVERGEAGAEFDWHLIRGTCTQLVGSIGAPERYPRLVLSAAGAAEQFATIGHMLDPSGQYAVVVHTDGGVRRLACGNLVRI